MDHQDLHHQDTGPGPLPQEGGVGLDLELELSVVFGVAVLCLISFLIYIYLAKRQVSGDPARVFVSFLFTGCAQTIFHEEQNSFDQKSVRSEKRHQESTKRRRRNRLKLHRYKLK